MTSDVDATSVVQVIVAPEKSVTLIAAMSLIVGGTALDESWIAYIEAGAFSQTPPGENVVGNEVRFVCVLAMALVPLEVLRKRT